LTQSAARDLVKAGAIEPSSSIKMPVMMTRTGSAAGVAAAFDLNAPADRIMTELVNASAALETFSESAESQPLPRFTAALKSAGQEFGAALTAKPVDRTTFSDAATSKFVEAKKCLDNYQK
jgi:hypothetical protein